MPTLTHSCPRCSAPFIPWRVWAITRWTCISCPACGARLNRRLDLQFAAVLLVGSMLAPVGFITLVASTSWLVWLPVLALFLLAFWLLDVLTVRLVIGKGR